MAENEGFRPDILEDDLLEEATEAAPEAEGNLDRLRQEVLEDAKELAQEIEVIAENPSPENISALSKILGILSEPMTRLKRLFSKEALAEVTLPEQKEIPKEVREKMVQLDEQANEESLRLGILSLLKELPGLKPPSGVEASWVAEQLGKEQLTSYEAGVINRQLTEAVKAFSPKEKDPERMALYEQLERFARALWKYHLLNPKKLSKPYEKTQSPADYAVGLMDLGVHPSKAIEAAQRDMPEYEASRRKHREAHSVIDYEQKMKNALSALDPNLDFIPLEPGVKEKQEEDLKNVG